MKNKRRKRTRRQPAVQTEVCEVRQLLSAVSVQPASIDGSDNNSQHPDWGSTEIELLRISDADYADALSEPAGTDRPSAREISNVISAQSGSILNDRNLTDYVWIWGQFLDHDIDLSESADPSEAFNISVPTGDVHFDPFGTGQVEIGLNRSAYVEGDDSSDGTRQQLNHITAFLDGSVVYGSDQIRADALRSFAGGQLKISEGDLLPFNEQGLPNAGGPSDTLFLAGDVRANENVLLTSMHTVFVREHNRLADEIAERDPSLTDEQIYQQARKIVTAQLQVITYNEFLPALLGPDAISEYGGYDPTVNPGIANEFSTAAYRFGHSLLSSELQRVGPDGEPIEAGSLSLQDAFFRPQQIVENGFDDLLRGAAVQLAQEIDTQVVDDVRNFLFGPPGAGGLDLASLNIQRGRDHGLADYNQVRSDLGLDRVNSFDQITSDPELAAALEATYGDVDNIDLWVGGLAEDHQSNSSMGETFTAIIVDQFERIRSGDRYWYQNTFSGRQLQQLEQTSLSDIIQRNTDITGLQTNVFFLPGTEELTVRTSDSKRGNISVRQRDDRIEVVDVDTGRTLVTRPADEVAALRIVGADGKRDRISVDAGLPAMQLTIDGGRGGGDEFRVIGTPGDDFVCVEGKRLVANDLDVVFEQIDDLMLFGNRGDDVLDAADSDVRRNLLDGGAGNDRLLGSAFSDRMFGGPGQDLLRGGAGNDVMSGGEDNDRLYGQQGRDDMNGGPGKDIVMQDGSGDRPEDMPRLAAFLQQQLQLRNTGNTFENWGGRGEKWIWSGAQRSWMFITPDGTLHRWDGSAGASGEVIASLDPSVFSNLRHLTTEGRRVDDDSQESLRRMNESVGQRLQLRVANSLFENWAGLGERWIWGRDGWYFLTPDGMLYQFDATLLDSTSIPGIAVADLGEEAFERPDRLSTNARRRS